MEGRDVRIRFDFHAHPSVATSRELDEDQICYLSMGDAIILCSADGSYLLFASQDGLQLLEDNPLWRLRPMDKGIHGRAVMQTYVTVFLIAGSLDKLPDSLADYLDDPGSHPREAQALARMLLDPAGVAFPAIGHDGTFSVTVALTADGRDKILDALQEVEDRRDVFMASQEVSR